MARINIEEKWWHDPRRRTLRILLGSDTTEQVAVNAWRTASDYWCDKQGCHLVPGHVFIHFHGWKELIGSGLAILYNTGQVDSTNFRANVEHIRALIDHPHADPNLVKQCHVYLAGLRESFSNFIEHRQKKIDAGKKSVQKRKKLYGTAQPKLEHNPNTTQTGSFVSPNSSENGKKMPPQQTEKDQSLTKQINRNSNTTRTQSNTPELSYSSSLSFSKNIKQELKGSENRGIQPSADSTESNPIKIRMSKFIATYVQTFQNRYGSKTRPCIRGKDQGLIKNLLESISLERACALIQVYLQMDGKGDWFVTRHHDLVTFTENLNTVSVALDTGQNSTGIRWDQVLK